MKLPATRFSNVKHENELFAENVSADNVTLMGEMIALRLLLPLHSMIFAWQINCISYLSRIFTILAKSVMQYRKNMTVRRLLFASFGNLQGKAYTTSAVLI